MVGWNVGGAFVTLAVVLAWSAVARLRLVSPVFLPSPEATGQALWAGLNQGDLASLTVGTVERMVVGWLLASIAGVVLGGLLGVSPALRTYLQPTLEFMRPLPASAIMPVGIALFGLTPIMVTAVVAFGAIWPVMLSSAHGFSAVEPRLTEVARILRLSRLAFLVKIGLPSALPDVLAGVRLSLTIALILAVVGEMLASQQGLGMAILLAARSFHAADLFAGIVMLSVVGFVGNALLQACERRALAWQATT
ncbi:MAG TPA: ABC transporter permease [Burkholderiaceae bacterium]|nr:ABC transporter permease [Burkholderiaceae bacterium]